MLRMITEKVILVDEDDNELGRMEKLQAHKEGRLHRAVSVFIVNSDNQWLLQKRANNKYHSGGLWSNATCTHPRPDELPLDAARRRLIEEMGISCELMFCFNFIYKCSLENGLTEHELDFVYIGYTDASPVPDVKEVSDFRYSEPDVIKRDISENPHLYTEWFKLLFDKLNALME